MTYCEICGEAPIAHHDELIAELCRLHGELRRMPIPPKELVPANEAEVRDVA